MNQKLIFRGIEEGFYYNRLIYNQLDKDFVRFLLRNFLFTR